MALATIPKRSLRIHAALLLLWPWLPSRAQQPASPAAPAERPADKSAVPDTPAQIELLETHFRFESNGDSRKEVHTRVRINSELGVRQFSRLHFNFNRSFEQIEIPQLHITHNSGGTADILPSAITDQPDPAVTDAPAYQDVRVKSVRILGLSPGDTLEYRVVTTTTGPPLAPDFWLEHSFDRTGVVSEENFELDLPARSFLLLSDQEAGVPAAPDPVTLKSPADIGRVGISARTPETSKVQQGEGQAARLVYRWNLNPANIPKVSESASPGESEEPDIVVTTFSSWEYLQRRLQFAVPFRPSTAIWSQAAALRRSSHDGGSVESAYYDLVSTKVKTVDLPLDFRRFRNRRDSEILSSGYGTPEDKAVLLRTLLSERSGKPRVLLVASSPSPEKQLPRPSVLTQVLLALEDGKRTSYLDPSLEVAPFGVIRADTRSKKALDLGANCFGADCWRTISNELPFPASQRVHVDATVTGDGTLTAKVKYSMRGDNELLLRVAFYQSPRNKWKEVAQLLALSDGFRGTILSASASDPTSTKLPFAVEYEISQPKFVEWSNQPVHIPALLPQLGIPELPAKPASGRATAPIDLGTPLDVDTRVTLHLPPGTSVEVPTGTVVDRDYATFASRYNTQEAVITASRHIHFLHRQVPADRSADYAAFLHAVQTDQSQQFTLTRQAPQASTPKGQQTRPVRKP